jgi:hypothetical protein
MDVQLTKKEDSKKPVEMTEKARKYNLTAHTTALLSAEQLQDETDIGKSYDPHTGQPLLGMLFAGKTHEYRTTVDDADGRYLSWKIEDEPEKVPTLDDSLRPEVVKQWKRGAGMDDGTGKARDLALKAAEELADKIRKGQSVAEAAKSIPGAKVIETDHFSWLSAGGIPSPLQQSSEPPKLSKIDEVDDAGPEFMQKVFSLKPGEVGVAMNHPKTMVYVVQVRSLDTNPRLMVDTFVADLSSQKSRSEANMAAQLEMLELSRRLFEQIDKDYHVQWKVPVSELANKMRG